VYLMNAIAGGIRIFSAIMEGGVQVAGCALVEQHRSLMVALMHGNYPE
jgi:hypothetical protein